MHGALSKLAPSIVVSFPMSDYFPRRSACDEETRAFSIDRTASAAPANSGAAYRIGEDQVSVSLQCEISTRLTSEMGLGRVKTRRKALEAWRFWLVWRGLPRFAGLVAFAFPGPSRGGLPPVLSGPRGDEGGLHPHHRQKRLNTHDVHDPREIVGKYVQGHLGTNFRQALQ